MVGTGGNLIDLTWNERPSVLCGRDGAFFADGKLSIFIMTFSWLVTGLEPWNFMTVHIYILVIS